LKIVHVLGVPLLIFAMAYYLADMRWSQEAQVWYGEEQVAQQGEANGAPANGKSQ
jgi:hypothetical protein